MTDNKNLETQIADDLSAVLKEAKKMGCKKVTRFSDIPLENLEIVIKALTEIQPYREINQRLKKIYGDFDDLLEVAITYLENHNGIDFPGNVGKSRLLTDDDVDRWEAYKELGTVEELKSMKENGAFSGVELAQLAVIQMRLKEYQQLGTLEQVREAVEKQKKYETQWLDDMNNPLEPLKLSNALQSEIFKLEYRKANKPKEISILDYTVIYALKDCLERYS